MIRNFAFTGVSIGSRLLTGLFLFVLLARLWGPADFGLFSFLFSLVAIIVLLVDFGFAGYLLREVGAKPDALPHLFYDALTTKSWLLVPCLLITLLAALGLGESAPAELLMPLLLSALMVSYAEFCIAPLRALGRYDVETGVVVSANLLQFLLAGFVAWQGGGPVAVAWVIVLSRFGYLVLAWFSLRRTAPNIRTGQRSGEGIRATVRRILPYGVDGLLTTAWSQLDVVLVRALYGVQAAGVYAAGQKVVQGAASLAPVVGNVMIPKLARQATDANPAFAQTASRTKLLMWMTGMLFASPLLIAPDYLAGFLFGPSYSELGDLFRLFGMVLLLRYIAASFGVLVTSVGLQSKRIKAQLLGIGIFLSLAIFGVFFEAALSWFLFSYGAGFFLIALLYRKYWRSFDAT